MLDLNYQIQEKIMSKDEIQNNLSFFGVLDFQKIGPKSSLKDLQNGLSRLLSDENSEEEQVYDLQMLQFLDKSLLNLKKMSPNDTQISLLIYNHLEFISSVTNLIAGLEVYTNDEMYNFLIEGDIQYEKLRFFHTLRQSRTSGSKHNYCLTFLQYIRSDKKMNLPQTEQKIFQSLILDTLWANFDNLPFDGRKFLCTEFYLFSIIHGVPVEQNLKEYFYSTTTSVEFIEECSKVFSYLGNNTEDFFSNQELKKMVQCIKEFQRQVSDQEYSKDSCKDFILKNYPDVTQNYQQSLIEAIHIFVQIKLGIIIDKNVGGEPDVSDIVEKEMFQLIRWFSKKEEWVKISEYFKKSSIAVPKDLFFDRMKKVFNFSDENDIDLLGQFSEMLLENKVINDQLFLFDEDTDKFLWNTKAYK